MPLLARVRAATATAHQSLEDHLDIFTKIADPSTRRSLVARFYGLHAGLETALAPHLATWPGLDFDGRRRTPSLRRDMEALGVDPAQAPSHPAPSIRSAAEALGVLYVMEGSTLGGAVIEKQLKNRGVSLEGLSFLHPYGDQTGPQWKAFLAILGDLDEALADDVVAGAGKGFALTQSWLCPEAATA